MQKIILACVTLLLATVGTTLGLDHAYIWDATNGPRDLGSLGTSSYAYGINDSGAVIGYYIPVNKPYQHGFIWTEATGMVNLGIPGGGDSARAWCIPRAINSAGHVVGDARQVDGRQVAFYWTPEDGFTVLGDISTNADNGNTAFGRTQIEAHVRVGDSFFNLVLGSSKAADVDDWVVWMMFVHSQPLSTVHFADFETR